MQASHGGKATNDQSDAQHIAVLLRGGLRPQASVSPAARRATRALLRRRMPLARKRGARLAHVHNTKRQDHLPAIGQTMASKTHRAGVAARFADPAAPPRIAVDLARIPASDERLRDVALTIVHTAKPHDAKPLYRLHTGPGIGKMLSLGLRDDLPDSPRFPRVQDCVS
jgi:hypothetical protein